jgi:hypothetical protein
MNRALYGIGVSRVEEVILGVLCTEGVILARAAIDMNIFSSTGFVLIP